MTMSESTIYRIMCALLAGIVVVGGIIGCGTGGYLSDTKKNFQSYETIIDSLPNDTYYAFADIGKTHDALLVTTSDQVFDNGDKTWAATEAIVYCFDENESIKEYGKVEGGGTATPLACKNGELYVGGHNYMNKIRIDEDASEMLKVNGEYFDEYEDATVVQFTQIYR